MKRACLSGKDVADLLEGKAVSVFGTEFVYDGTAMESVQKAISQIGAEEEPAKRKPARQER